MLNSYYVERLRGIKGRDVKKYTRKRRNFLNIGRVAEKKVYLSALW